MRVFRSLSTVIGLAILAILVALVGKDETLAATARALGWQSLLVCLLFVLIMAVDTLGWRYAFAYDRVPFLRLMAARVAGEAVNVMTAVAPVGGDAIKVWFLRPHVPYRESVASVIIAKTTITLSQTLFLLLGVAVALALSVDARLVAAMLWLLLAELVGAGGFLLVQVTGLLGRGARRLARFGKLKAIASAENLDQTLQSFYRRQWQRFSFSMGFHLLGWLMGVFETWLFLKVLHVPASLATAVVIETLGSAVRFATFFMPGSRGASRLSLVGEPALSQAAETGGVDRARGARAPRGAQTSPTRS